VGRRGKYLLINTEKGTAILHLGMSLSRPAALRLLALEQGPIVASAVKSARARAAQRRV
jgi:formamidopyrimidine-DNA glycosylase